MLPPIQQHLPDQSSTKISSCPPCVLLLNGFPGVGKLTVARGIHEKLSGTSRLVDNHLLIDPVLAIMPTRDKAHYDLRKAFRQTVFDGLKRLKEREDSLVVISTACLTTSPFPTVYDDVDQLRQFLDLSQGMGVKLVLVSLVCGLERNKERLGSAERMEGKMKLLDGDILEGIRTSNTLLSREVALGCVTDGDLLYFEVDVSDLEIEETVRRVWECLQGRDSISED